MSKAEMTSANNVLHAVASTSTSFLVGLHNCRKDESVLEFMITHDNKQLCYVSVVSDTLRHHLVDPYNVIVDVPSTQPNLCNHSKTFHSLESWNDKKNDVLARSSFDSIVKTLESQHADDIFTFVLERLTKDNLQVVYENTKFIFTAKVNELDLIKLKIPSNAELSGIFQGDRTMYDERIKDRLSCKICLKYDVPLLGGLPLSKPFQCLHYFHSQCITNWKEFGLTSGECRGHLNICFYCRSELSSQYTDLYDYDWNLDGTVTRSNNNKRFPSVVDNNKASTRLSLSDSNITNPNQIRDDQDDRLKVYKTMHEEQQRLFVLFMNDEKKKSCSKGVVRTYPTRKRTPTDYLLNNHPLNTNNRLVIKPPKNVVLHNMFDDPVSILSTATSSSKFPGTKKKRKYNEKIKAVSKKIMKDKDKGAVCKGNDDEKLKQVKERTKIMKDVGKGKECNVKHDLTLKHEIDSETTDSDRTESDRESDTEIDYIEGNKCVKVKNVIIDVDSKQTSNKKNAGAISQQLFICVDDDLNDPCLFNHHTTIGNGHCGYESVLRSLVSLGLEIINKDFLFTTNLLNFRKKIQNKGRDEIKNPNSPFTKHMNQRKIKRDHLDMLTTETLLANIWNENMKENWCSEESWFSIMILPLITYMYESVTFISINISNTVKNSFLMCYKNKDYKIVEEHNVNIPKPEANKVYIQYDGINHYTYWTPKIPLILTTTSRIEMEKTIRVTMDMVKTDNTSEKDITELISDKQKQLIDKEDTLNVVRYIQNEIADHYLEN